MDTCSVALGGAAPAAAAVPVRVARLAAVRAGAEMS